MDSKGPVASTKLFEGTAEDRATAVVVPVVPIARKGTGGAKLGGIVASFTVTCSIPGGLVEDPPILTSRVCVEAVFRSRGSPVGFGRTSIDHTRSLTILEFAAVGATVLFTGPKTVDVLATSPRRTLASRHLGAAGPARLSRTGSPLSNFARIRGSRTLGLAELGSAFEVAL
jgi:hypothetical protein